MFIIHADVTYTTARDGRPERFIVSTDLAHMSSHGVTLPIALARFKNVLRDTFAGNEPDVIIDSYKEFA